MVLALRARTLATSILVIVATSTGALAERAPARPEKPSAEDVRAAARRFAEGEAAFRAHDFARAAEAFDAAYELAPHEDAIWNSAQAWQRAGELARAANLYARYLRIAPGAAPDRGSATTALAQLAGKLGRLDLVAPEGSALTVDGRPADLGAIYVTPGDHVVRARGKGAKRDRTQTAAVTAGQAISVAFADEADPAPAEGTPREPPPRPPPPPAPGAEPSGIPLWVIASEGAATALVGGFAIASAVDTRHARNAFLASPTEANLDAGRGKETRTNVLLGTTAGLAVLTAVTALWGIDTGNAPADAAARGGFALSAAVGLDGGAGRPSGVAVASGRF